jgi:hypothetical protein
MNRFLPSASSRLFPTVTVASCSAFLFLTPAAYAIVDFNNNGVSDLWEKIQLW